MARKRKLDPSTLSDGGGFDMTPMIDCVFQLIIFFMVCTAIDDSSKAQVILPQAEKAEKDEPIPGRMVLNVVTDGKIRLRHDEYDLAVKTQRDKLGQVLEIQRNLSTVAGQEHPTQAVLIRADRATEFGNVHQLMALIMEHKLWRIAFATKDKIPGSP